MLLAFSAVLSVVAIREVLLIRLDGRIDAATDQEISEFDRLVVDGRDPETGEPFASLEALLDVSP